MSNLVDIVMSLIKIWKISTIYRYNTYAVIMHEENVAFEKAFKQEWLVVEFEYTAPGMPQQNGQVPLHQLRKKPSDFCIKLILYHMNEEKTIPNWWKRLNQKETFSFPITWLQSSLWWNKSKVCIICWSGQWNLIHLGMPSFKTKIISELPTERRPQPWLQNNHNKNRDVPLSLLIPCCQWCYITKSQESTWKSWQKGNQPPKL